MELCTKASRRPSTVCAEVVERLDLDDGGQILRSAPAHRVTLLARDGSGHRRHTTTCPRTP